MIVAQVRRTIEERRLLREGDGVVVACSGGPDSVALTHALAALRHDLGVTLVVASVDHGLRPEAREEVARVGSLAEALGLPFRPLTVRVSGEGSLQEAARAARYAALQELAGHVGARRIAVGHTRDDQAETVLARLLRGAGLDGLGGIAPRRADGVIRPLLDCRRSEVEAHLAHHGLGCSRDPSNEDPRFERVRIRRSILPALEAEDPGVVVHLARVADDARAASRLVRSGARRLLARAEGPDGLRVSALRGGAEAARRAALRRWVEAQTGRRPGRAHLEALDHLIAGRGEVLLGDGWAVRVVSGRLVAERRAGRRTRSHKPP